MLSTLIIISVITWIAGFLVNGICLYNIAVIIPVIMFGVRKVGIHVSQSNIITAEVILIVFSLIWRLIFHKFIIWKFIVTILIRLVFIGVLIYDETMYVYVSEERKKI